MPWTEDRVDKDTRRNWQPVYSRATNTWELERFPAHTEDIVSLTGRGRGGGVQPGIVADKLLLPSPFGPLQVGKCTSHNFCLMVVAVRYESRAFAYNGKLWSEKEIQLPPEMAGNETYSTHINVKGLTCAGPKACFLFGGLNKVVSQLLSRASQGRNQNKV